MTGTLKSLAALASPMTLLKRSCRSIDITPKVICGWWSMKMTAQFCGVSRLWMRFGGAAVSAIGHSFEESVDVSSPGRCSREYVQLLRPRPGPRGHQFGGGGGLSK